MIGAIGRVTTVGTTCKGGDKKMVLDASDKTALAVTLIGAAVAVLGSVSTSLSAGGLTVGAGISAAIAGLTYYEAHATVPPKAPAPPAP